MYMYFAAGFGRKEVVEYLLQFGADVHARDDGKWNLKCLSTERFFCSDKVLMLESSV